MATLDMIGGVDIVTEIRPRIVEPGRHLRFRSGPSEFIFVFNNDEDRRRWLDIMEEQIFNLNHPKIGKKP